MKQLVLETMMDPMGLLFGIRSKLFWMATLGFMLLAGLGYACYILLTYPKGPVTVPEFEHPCRLARGKSRSRPGSKRNERYLTSRRRRQASM
jgi:hypothetical protein